MEEYFSYVIYIIIAILYFIFSGSSNKNKSPQNQKKPLATNTKTQSTSSSQSEFDAYLKEIQQKKINKENINIFSESSEEKTYLKEEHSLENTKFAFKSLETTESDLTIVPKKKPRKTFIQLEVTETDLITKKNSKKKTNEMIRFLKNKDTLKKVFIANEIFNKKI